jgi:IS30 family transposase
MGKEYSHLGYEERCRIEACLGQGLSKRAIARLLGRPHSTIVRELNRNTGAVVYAPHTAQAAAQNRHTHPRKKLDHRPVLWMHVQDQLNRGWSPEQIAGKLKRMRPPDPHDPFTEPFRVSHETIYAYIYAHPRGSLRTALIARLRRSHKTRKPRTRGVDRRGKITDMTPISERPKDVESRVIPGHWEGDLIKGKYNRSSVGTLVERTSRYVILVKLENATAPVVHQGFVREMKNIPPEIRKSLTYDQGREMSLHKQVASDLNLTVYFADPHSPWQRGSNENTNGLIREYLPKGSDLSIYSQDQLNEISSSKSVRSV